MTWTWKNNTSLVMLGSLLLGTVSFGGAAAAPANSSGIYNGTLSVTSGKQGRTEPANVTNSSDNKMSGDEEQRVIVTFKDKKKVDGALIKGKIKRQQKYSRTIAAKMTSKEIEKLKKDSSIESVEPDIQLQTASTQTMDWGVSVVHATYAWDNGYTGKGVKVAVLDSGIDTHHEDLVIAGGASFVDYTTSYDDDNGHGTHVAGIIGARNNDVGVVGVAPEADLYAVKVLDSAGKGYLSDVIAGIDWAVDHQMDIINMSMATNVDSPALHQAVDEAYASGLLIVAAAGNTGNVEGTGDTIQYPAKYGSVIAVGAVDQNNQRASFSATGEALEVVAPGVGIKSTYMNGGYESLNGTSMAAAMVAGGLMLVKQQYPLKNNGEIRSILDQYVSDMNDHVTVLDIEFNDTEASSANNNENVEENPYLNAASVGTGELMSTTLGAASWSGATSSPAIPSGFLPLGISTVFWANTGGAQLTPGKYYIINPATGQTAYKTSATSWSSPVNGSPIPEGFIPIGISSDAYSGSGGSGGSHEVIGKYFVINPTTGQIFARSPGVSDWSTYSNGAAIPLGYVPLGISNNFTKTSGSASVRIGKFYIVNPSTGQVQSSDGVNNWIAASSIPAIPAGYAPFGLSSNVYVGSGGTRGIYEAINAINIINFTANRPPVLSINNADQLADVNGTINISGTVSDSDNDSITINATLAGITKSLTIANTSTIQSWNLQWDLNNDHIPVGSYSNIVITANDGNWGVDSSSYLGSIIVDNYPGTPTALNPGSAISSAPVLLNGLTPLFYWTFTDMDAGDTQSAYDVQIYDSAGTTLIADSGWINSEASNYTVPAGKLARGTTYSWRVAVKDSKGGVSSYSPLSYTKTNNLPTAAFSSYTDGQTLSDNVLNFTWTYADADGQAQSSYRIQGSKDNWATIGYDSGIKTGVATSLQTPALPDGTWSFKMTVNDGMEWSETATRNHLNIPNAYEPNDTTAQAFAINYNTPYTSSINSTTDVDFFKYVAPATGIDRLIVTVPSDKNYDVYVYDSSMKFVAASLALDSGATEDTLYRVISNSTYYIKVVGVDGDFGASPYELKVNKYAVINQTNYQFDSNGNITGKTTTSN